MSIKMLFSIEENYPACVSTVDISVYEMHVWSAYVFWGWSKPFNFKYGR